MHIRTLKEEDAEAVAELHKKAILKSSDYTPKQKNAMISWIEKEQPWKEKEVEQIIAENNMCIASSGRSIRQINKDKARGGLAPCGDERCRIMKNSFDRRCYAHTEKDNNKMNKKNNEKNKKTDNKDKKVLGFARYTIAGELKAMYIDPKEQKKGIGTALLNFIENEWRKNSITKAFLCSAISAKTFYEKQGYIVTKTEKSLLFGEPCTAFFMEKKL